MGKKRNIEIQKIVNANLSLNFNWFNVDMCGEIYGVHSEDTPTYDVKFWASNNEKIKYLGSVKKFKASGWMRHLYNQKGIRCGGKT